MNRSIVMSFREEALSALNARADVLSKQDANAWEEAVEWGVPDCNALCASQWRVTVVPDFD